MYLYVCNTFGHGNGTKLYRWAINTKNVGWCLPNSWAIAVAVTPWLRKYGRIASRVWNIVGPLWTTGYGHGGIPRAGSAKDLWSQCLWRTGQEFAATECLNASNRKSRRGPSAFRSVWEALLEARFPESHPNFPEHQGRYIIYSIIYSQLWSMIKIYILKSSQPEVGNCTDM